MQPVPDDILKQFNAVLELKKVPSGLRDEYRKWLLYYLDFRAKYPPPDSRSEQVRLFVEKARSKGRSGKSLQQAAHAISLYFQSQGRSTVAVDHVERSRTLSSSGSARTTSEAPVRQAPSHSVPLVARMTARSGGRKYDEWWCLEQTKSPEWDAVIEILAGEIKPRHYSRKTLKAY